METVLFEAFFIAILVLFNGYLAGTEIAVVTAKRTEIQRMAEKGARSAKTLLKLKEDPERFLATVQVGITLVGVLYSALGSTNVVKVIKPVLQEVPIGA